MTEDLAARVDGKPAFYRGVAAVLIVVCVCFHAFGVSELALMAALIYFICAMFADLLDALRARGL